LHYKSFLIVVLDIYGLQRIRHCSILGVVG
jgi:hypothetical protein